MQERQIYYWLKRNLFQKVKTKACRENLGCVGGEGGYRGKKFWKVSDLKKYILCIA